MLLVDMGAGTTDLAVCRYRVKAGGPVIRVDQIENEIIATWPMDSGAATFGGREVDRVLEEYIIDYLVSCGFPAGNAEQAVRGSGNSSTAAKRWKETTVSKALNDGKRVESCAFVTPFMMFLPQAKPFPAFGRREFEAMLGEKVEDFKDLVAGCLAQVSRAEPELLAKKLDLVILTGGHSSWYFVEELLNGAMPGLSLPQLELVQRERSRVIRLTNPQETVALGLVYSRLPFQVAAPEPAVPAEREGTGIGRTIKAAKDTAAALKDTGRAVGQLGKAVAAEKEAKPQPGGGAAKESRISEKWPTNDKLALCAKEFIGRYEAADKSIKTLTRGSLATMRKKLLVPDSDEVFLYHDDTIFSSGKNGFVFCTSGIITKGLASKRTFVSWLSFATGFIRPLEVNGQITFCDSVGTTQMLTYGSDNGCTKADVHRFLGALQAHLRSRFGLEELPRKMGLTDAGSVSNEQLAKSAAAFITGYDQNVIRRNSRGDPAAAAKHLDIPADAEFYLYHDDTYSETGKAGFAITSRGFYCLTGELGSQRVFTEWRTFFANSLEVEQKALFATLCRRDAVDGVTKPLAYTMPERRATDLFVFFAHLHAYLRELYI